MPTPAILVRVWDRYCAACRYALKDPVRLMNRTTLWLVGALAALELAALGFLAVAGVRWAILALHVYAAAQRLALLAAVILTTTPLVLFVLAQPFGFARAVFGEAAVGLCGIDESLPK